MMKLQTATDSVRAGIESVTEKLDSVKVALLLVGAVIAALALAVLATRK